jgi:hypothetical protein
MTVGEIHTKVCTRHFELNRFEQLAEKKSGENLFHSELHLFLKPLSGNESIEFLGELKSCFGAERKVHPHLKLPKYDDWPQPHEIT